MPHASLRNRQPIEFREGEDMAKTLKAQKKAEQAEFESYKKAQADHKKLFAETQALEKKISQVLQQRLVSPPSAVNAAESFAVREWCA